MTSTRFTVPAALAVALSLALTITGCGGGGGGGGGGGPIQQPPTTNKAPIIDGQPTASPNPATEGAGGNVTISFAAHDPEGKTLTVQWRQIGGSNVALSPSASGNTFSASFLVPAAGSYQFIADVDDPEMARTSTSPITVTVNVAGPPPPPAGPAIGPVTVYGRQLHTDSTWPQVIRVNYPTPSGMSASDVTVRIRESGPPAGAWINGGWAVVLGTPGTSSSDILVRLPAVTNAGSYDIQLEVPGRSPSLKLNAFTFQPVGTTYVFLNREDLGANKGAYAIATVNAAGVPQNPIYESGPFNGGHNNFGGQAPTNVDSEVVSLCSVAADDGVVLYRYGPSNTRPNMVICDGSTTTGRIMTTLPNRSVATTRDGNKLAALWGDFANTRGAGSIGYLCIADTALTASATVPLPNLGAFNQVTGCEVVEWKFDNGWGNNTHQSFHVFAARTTPPKLFLTPMEDNPSNSAIEVALNQGGVTPIVNPQVIFVYLDKQSRSMVCYVFGTNTVTSNVEIQKVTINELGVLVGPAEALFGSSTAVRSVHMYRDSNSGHLMMIVGCFASSGPVLIDTLTNQAVTSTYPVGGMLLSQCVALPGHGVASVGEVGSDRRLFVHSVTSFGTAQVLKTSNAFSQSLCVGERGVGWEERSTDVFSFFLSPGFTQQTVTFPSDLGLTGIGAAVTSGHLGLNVVD